MAGVFNAPANQLDRNTPPFTTFNFLVEIRVDGVSPGVCAGAFAECDGLEMTMETKTIREGGRNSGPVHMVGPVNYGQLVLKRGMTSNFDLWSWFESLLGPGMPGGLPGDLGAPSAISAGPGGIGTSAGTKPPAGALRASAEIVMLAADGATEQARFLLTGCLPVKLKAPALNARDGLIAIEEMTILYESLHLEPGR
jgi:phage tail-like protein